MADEVKASGKNTTISVSAASRKALEDFKEARGYATVPEAFDAVVKIMVEQEFNSAHPDHAAALDAVDELFAKVRKAVEGIIISSEESAAKVQARADKDIQALNDKVEALKAKDAELDQAKAYAEDLEVNLDRVQRLLEDEHELTNLNGKRIAELEAERESVKAREAEAEAAIAAKAEAEKAQLAAEKVAEEAKADLAAVQAEAEKAAVQGAADLKAASDAAKAAADLAASELTHASDRAAKAEGRAEALEGELARVRDERNASRSEVAALKAEVAGLERQIALMQDLLKPAPAADQE